jgi:hypothetical protein
MRVLNLTQEVFDRLEKETDAASSSARGNSKTSAKGKKREVIIYLSDSEEDGAPSKKRRKSSASPQPQEDPAEARKEPQDSETAGGFVLRGDLLVERKLPELCSF